MSSIRIADLNRKLDFRPLAFMKLVDSLANLFISVLLARPFGVMALVVGSLAGTSLSLLMSYIFAPHSPRLSFDRESAKPLIQFGRWIFITSLVILAGNNVLRIVISRQLGVKELGLYYLAVQLAFLPSGIASEVIGSVAFPLFARLQSDIRKLTYLFRTVLTGMIAVLFPVCFLIIALAPSLVENILGTNWAGTESVIRILTFATLIGLFLEVEVPLLQGVGQPSRVTVIEIVQSLIIIVLVVGLTSLFGLVGAALAWIPALFFSQLVGAIFVNKVLIKPFEKISTSMITIAIISVLSALVAFWVDNLIPGVAGFVIANSIAGVILVGLFWLSDHYFNLGLLDNLGQVFPQVVDFMGSLHARIARS